jgi:hypothetical protein
MTLMNPNELWKKYRKVMHSWLNKQAVVSFKESQQRQARLLLQRLLDCSESLESSEIFDEQFNRYVLSNIAVKLPVSFVSNSTIAATLLGTLYGYNLESADDSFVKNAGIFTDRLALAFQPSSQCTNDIPA